MASSSMPGLSEITEYKEDNRVHPVATHAAAEPAGGEGDLPPIRGGGIRGEMGAASSKFRSTAHAAQYYGPDTFLDNEARVYGYDLEDGTKETEEQKHKRMDKEEGERKKAEALRKQTHAQKALRIYGSEDEPAEGSVLLPIVHFVAEQFCCYSRKNKQWFGRGGDALRRQGKWRWEMVSVLVLAGAVALGGYVLYTLWTDDDSSPPPAPPPPCPMAEEEPSDHKKWWLTFTVCYLLIAYISFQPVIYSFLVTPDFGGIAKMNDGHNKKYLTPLRSHFISKMRMSDSRCLLSMGPAGTHARPELIRREKERLGEQLVQNALATRADLTGALLMWGKWSKMYRVFNNYANAFSITGGILLPLLSQLATQGASSSYSGMLLTVVSAHIGILIAVQKGLRTDEKFRSFRMVESLAMDGWRRLVSMPWTFRKEDENSYYRGGDDGSEKYLDTYSMLVAEVQGFAELIEECREMARKAETFTGGDRDSKITGMSMSDIRKRNAVGEEPTKGKDEGREGKAGEEKFGEEQTKAGDEKDGEGGAGS